MADDTFYMRVRGKVSGPFDIPTLQKLVRRGALSRIHEVSGDRITWTHAGEYEDLFPSTVHVPHARPQQAEEEPIELSLEHTQTAPSPPPSGTGQALYFYTQRGSTVGPVPMPVLRTLVENGTLRMTDLVWRENAETGAPAGQMPALAPLFGASPPAYASPGRFADDATPEQTLRAMTAATGQSRIAGIATGVMLLLLLNLPWLVVNKQAIYWWDLFRTREGQAWGSFTMYLVLMGITLCIVAPLATGLARSIVYLSLIVAGWIFLSVILMSVGASPAAMSALLIPMSLAMLLGVCQFRGTAPHSSSARICMGITSGIIVLAMLWGIIGSLLDNGAWTAMPGGVAFGVIVAYLGLFSGLAAGVMGLISLKPIFSHSLNLATKITALCALVLPGIGIFIIMASVAQSFLPFGAGGTDIAALEAHEMTWVITLVTARALLVGYGCLAIVIVGIRELFTAAHARAIARA